MVAALLARHGRSTFGSRRGPRMSNGGRGDMSLESAGRGRDRDPHTGGRLVRTSWCYNVIPYHEDAGCDDDL